MRSSLRSTRFVCVCAFLRFRFCSSIRSRAYIAFFSMYCSTPSVENTSKTHLHPLIELLCVSDALVHPALDPVLQPFVHLCSRISRLGMRRQSEQHYCQCTKASPFP
jgi:hypothetical protein